MRNEGLGSSCTLPAAPIALNDCAAQIDAAVHRSSHEIDAGRNSHCEFYPDIVIVHVDAAFSAGMAFILPAARWINGANRNACGMRHHLNVDRSGIAVPRRFSSFNQYLGARRTLYMDRAIDSLDLHRLSSGHNALPVEIARSRQLCNRAQSNDE